MKKKLNEKCPENSIPSNGKCKRADNSGYLKRVCDVGYIWDDKHQNCVKMVKEQFKKRYKKFFPEKEGKCPESGCVKKVDDKWRVISNKTRKLWPQTYDSEQSAKDAISAYHVHH